MKKIITIFFTFLILITGGLVINSQEVSAKTKYIESTTPTIFFHGYGSSYHAEVQMADAARDAGVTKNIIRANVDRNGRVSFVGRLPKNAKNPIIEVNYDNSRMKNYHTDGKWAKNVITSLQKEYKFKKINLVGHSMGNMAIVYYLLDNANDKKLPKLNKQVDIAGHFNGILGQNDKPNKMKLDKNGKPTKMDKDYKELLKLRKTYPKSADVLNIYGDKNDGTHSDGDVSNASSKSLKYLVSDRAHSYQEKKIVGKMAQHSKLHENKKVDKILIDFLWGK